MKCRNLYNNETVVWFSSCGKNDDGTAMNVESFSSDIDAVTNSLNEKLRVMKTELWHSMNFGIPVLNKIKTKSLIDSEVIKIIMNTEGVISIDSFLSKVINNNYHCTVIINTRYGLVDISL